MMLARPCRPGDTLRAVAAGLLLNLSFGVGCRSPAAPQAAPGWTCLGHEVPPVQAGLEPVEGAAAEKEAAVMPPGSGGLCRATAYETTADLHVFRGWTPGVNNPRGHWWTFGTGAGDQDAYRRAHEICRSGEHGNKLTCLADCVLPPKTTVVVGPGQSVDGRGQYHCDDASETYQASPALQIYLPDAGVESARPRCTDRPWPGTTVPEEVCRVSQVRE